MLASSKNLLLTRVPTQSAVMRFGCILSYKALVRGLVGFLLLLRLDEYLRLRFLVLPLVVRFPFDLEDSFCGLSVHP